MYSFNFFPSLSSCQSPSRFRNGSRTSYSSTLDSAWLLVLDIPVRAAIRDLAAVGPNL